MVTREEILMEARKHQKEFLGWLQKAENIVIGTWKLIRGTYEIEVAERLIVGEYMFYEPELCIIRNPEGRIFAIPEDGSFMLKDKLVSRWNVHEGMRLRLRVGKEGIPEVLIIEN